MASDLEKAATVHEETTGIRLTCNPRISSDSESDKLVNVYECNVCHVLFGKHAPQCPVCHHGALSMVGSIVPERGQEQPP